MSTRETTGGRRSGLTKWVVSGVMLLSGVMLVSNRTPRPASTGDQRGAGSGRGEPGVPPSRQALRVGFETRDMSSKDMTWAGFVLASVVAAAVGVMFLMLMWFHSEDAKEQPKLTPEQQAEIVPPAPSLQSDPVKELQEQRGRERARLSGYAWANPDHTRARIPIDRAMALTVGQSLDNGP